MDKVLETAFDLKMLCKQKFSTSDYAGNKKALFVWKHAVLVLITHEQEMSSEGFLLMGHNSDHMMETI